MSRGYLGSIYIFNLAKDKLHLNVISWMIKKVMSNWLVSWNWINHVQITILYFNRVSFHGGCEFCFVRWWLILSFLTSNTPTCDTKMKKYPYSNIFKRVFLRKYFLRYPPFTNSFFFFQQDLKINCFGFTRESFFRPSFHDQIGVFKIGVLLSQPWRDAEHLLSCARNQFSLL